MMSSGLQRDQLAGNTESSCCSVVSLRSASSTPIWAHASAARTPAPALPPLEAGEYYHADLLGLPAVSSDGTALGEVIAVENFGAGDVIEIKRPTGKRFMVPMRIEAVPEWDEARIVITAALAAD